MTVTLSRPYAHYGLRTCAADGTSHGGFQWPESGLVTAPDWKPTTKCGNGLHALLDGEGDASLLNWSADAVWQLVGFDSYVDLDGKVKFQSCEVATGTRLAVTAALSALRPGATIHGATATAGYEGTATAGHRGTATAGERGTATAGQGGTATAGHRGTATAGQGGTATAGHRGTATAGQGGTATAGYEGTATAGQGGTATVGEWGRIQIEWWDGRRYRIPTGYVGENGIKPDTAYRLDDAGQFVEVGK